MPAMTRGAPWMGRPTCRSMLWLLAASGLVLALAAPPAHAQHAGGVHSQPERPATGGAGESARGEEQGEEQIDPSKHVNYVGIRPGHLFDYSGKDEFGGPLGDGKMTDPATGQVVHEEEPASPPFVFVLFNFAILLWILARWGRPLAQKTARERHDLIKTALDE